MNTNQNWPSDLSGSNGRQKRRSTLLPTPWLIFVSPPMTDEPCSKKCNPSWQMPHSLWFGRRLQSPPCTATRFLNWKKLLAKMPATNSARDGLTPATKRWPVRKIEFAVDSCLHCRSQTLTPKLGAWSRQLGRIGETNFARFRSPCSTLWMPPVPKLP